MYHVYVAHCVHCFLDAPFPELAGKSKSLMQLGYLQLGGLV